MTVKEKIIEELNKKETLSEKEIYLLQRLAGIKNLRSNIILVGPPGLEPGTNTL